MTKAKQTLINNELLELRKWRYFTWYLMKKGSRNKLASLIAILTLLKREAYQWVAESLYRNRLRRFPCWWKLIIRWSKSLTVWLSKTIFANVLFVFSLSTDLASPLISQRIHFVIPWSFPFKLIVVVLIKFINLLICNSTAIASVPFDWLNYSTSKTLPFSNS